MFDAGAIMAHLDVDTKLGDDKLRAFEDRVRRFEKQPHHVRVDAQFDNGSTNRARKMFADLDNMISRDAANRLRNSPQGSVLGSLNALFSPHPVSGAPTPLQASQQGLLGRMVNPPGTAAPQSRNVVSEAAATAAANEISGGGRGGILRMLRIGGGGGGGGAGGGGGGGFLSGLIGGIGPSILGLGARNLAIAGLAGPAVGALPALLGPLAGFGVAGVGLGAAGILLKGASQQVSPLLQLQNQIQQAQLTAATPQQKQALASQQASLNQAVGQLPAAQRQMYNAMSAISKGWQNFSQSFAPVLAKGLGMAARVFTSLMPLMRSFFASSLTLIRPFIQGLGDIAKMVLPGLGQAFRAVAPLVRPLLDGLGGLVKGILPGLVTMLRASRPAVTAFGQILGMIGRDLGSMFRSFAPVMSASAVILKALFGIIGGLLPIVGKLAAYFATLLAPVFRQFAAAIRALMPFLLTVGRVLAALASAVLKDLAGALMAVAKLIVGIAPALNIVAKAFSSMFSVLENTGVFASLGTALEKIAPLLANLINTLVRQLAPELPILIGLVSQFGQILITLLAAGLTTILKGFTWLLQKLPFLGPLLLALTAAWIAFDIASSANPVGLIVIAIIALIGAITLLVTHWKQVWGFIKSIALDAWNFIFHGFGKFLLPLLGPVGLIALGAIELYQHWKTIWGAIKTVALDFYHWIWTDFGQKIFTFLTQTLPGWFKTAVQFIGNAWNDLGNAVKAPVAFVINNVLDGLINAFDWITSHLGLGKPISPIHPFGLQHGGRIPGFGGGDRFPALLEGGETVIDKDTSRQLAWLWKILGIPGYQGGGAVPHGGGQGVSATVHGGAPAGGIPGFLGNLSQIGGIVAAIATGNSTALSNDIMHLIGHSGVGGATADMARLLLAIPHALVSDAVHWLFGHAAPVANAKFGIGRPVGHGAIGGGVQRWAGLVLQVLRMLGQPAGDLGTVLSQMTTESGGNPFAINLTDSNAAAGDPSRGLMQTIMTTFLAYAGPFRNRGIYDPLANIYAGLNYAIHRYGAGWTSVLGHGHGYDLGGWMMPGGLNQTGRPEAVLTPRQSDAFLALSHAAAGMGGSGISLADVVMALDRVTAAVQATPARTGAAVGASLDSTARGARQRAGVY